MLIPRAAVALMMLVLAGCGAPQPDYQPNPLVVNEPGLSMLPEGVEPFRVEAPTWERGDWWSYDLVGADQPTVLLVLDGRMAVGEERVALVARLPGLTVTNETSLVDADLVAIDPARMMERPGWEVNALEPVNGETALYTFVSESTRPRMPSALFPLTALKSWTARDGEGVVEGHAAREFHAVSLSKNESEVRLETTQRTASQDIPGDDVAVATYDAEVRSLSALSWPSWHTELREQRWLWYTGDMPSSGTARLNGTGRIDLPPLNVTRLLRDQALAAGPGPIRFDITPEEVTAGSADATVSWSGLDQLPASTTFALNAGWEAGPTLRRGVTSPLDATEAFPATEPLIGLAILEARHHGRLLGASRVAVALPDLTDFNEPCGEPADVVAGATCTLATFAVHPAARVEVDAELSIPLQFGLTAPCLTPPCATLRLRDAAGTVVDEVDWAEGSVALGVADTALHNATAPWTLEVTAPRLPVRAFGTALVTPDAARADWTRWQ